MQSWQSMRLLSSEVSVIFILEWRMRRETCHCVFASHHSFPLDLCPSLCFLYLICINWSCVFVVDWERGLWGHIDLFSDLYRTYSHTHWNAKTDAYTETSMLPFLFLGLRQTHSRITLTHATTLITPQHNPSLSFVPHLLPTSALRCRKYVCQCVFVCNRGGSEMSMCLWRYSEEHCRLPVRLCFLDVLF